MKELQFKEIRDKKENLKSITLVLTRKDIAEMSKAYPTHEKVAFNFFKKDDGSLKIVI